MMSINKFSNDKVIDICKVYSVVTDHSGISVQGIFFVIVVFCFPLFIKKIMFAQEKN